MTIAEATIRHFRNEAIRAITATGAHGVNETSITGNPLLREQFRAMLVDARGRFNPDGENYAAIEALIHECDSAAEHEPATLKVPAPGPGMILNAGGSGFMVHRLEEPGPKPLPSTLDELRKSIDDDRR